MSEMKTCMQLAQEAGAIHDGNSSPINSQWVPVLRHIRELKQQSGRSLRHLGHKGSLTLEEPLGAYGKFIHLPISHC